ncbi:hypothetical protein DUNSADRAFT_15147 [Dunaliella salina]|uniref:Uncharacterized protein n=1 Tax=Dunaliella salina TaxID=3046 RepID=A0ABQ7G637_DUNSA|nr:hypothetical protein DUNSADRAFT_15147 [Dunaliella salina]|eukprot:KAF5830038.1 hypothetical protein DUNSADRAFT_15147 [Dunaliella salina]
MQSLLAAPANRAVSTQSTPALAQRPLSFPPCVTSPRQLPCLRPTRWRRMRQIERHSVTPGTEEQRSPADAPQEWETPAPSRRPDIFPEFEKMERVFLPKPLPGDPEMPDEEAEEAKKRTFPGDPDPEQKPGEPAEPDNPPEEEGTDPENPEKSGDTPTIPE